MYNFIDLKNLLFVIDYSVLYLHTNETYLLGFHKIKSIFQ